MGRWGRHVLVAAVGVGLLVAGCSSGDDEAATGSSTSESLSGSSGCEPVGDGGGTEVGVTLDEWSVTPEPVSAPAGTVTFEVANEGEEAHELVVVRDVDVADLTVVDGRVDEDALPEGAFIGEVEGFPAGETCSGTFELETGDYVLFCNIVEEHEGELESHFEEGMATTFEVG